MKWIAAIIITATSLGSLTLFMISTKGDDGEARIVFSLSKNANIDIFSIDIDGKNLKNLTNHPASDSYPASSPNGRFIAFNSWRNGKPDIFVMDADGKNPRLLIENIGLRGVSWSPDSKWVAYIEGLSKLVAVNINSGERKKIIGDHNWKLFGENPLLTFTPAWSPDGKKIAFRILGVDGDNNNSEIYTIDVDGTNVKRLTNHPARDRSPTWSPDSKHIAFFSERGGGGIFIMDSDGMEQNVKLIHKNPADCCPSWSPDGQKIVFSSLVRIGTAGIFVMNSDGGDVKLIFDEADGVAGMPSWLEQGWFNIESENKWITTWGKMKNR